MATSCVESLAGGRARGGTLIASSDPQFRRKWARGASACGGNVTGMRAGGQLDEVVAAGAEALAKLEEFAWARVVLDSRLPDLDAAEVAATIRQRYPYMPVEVVDARSGIEAPPERTGDAIYGELETDVAGPKRIFNTEDTEDTEDTEKSEKKAEERVEGLPGIVGTSRVMQEMYQLVRLVAARDTTVLVTGETGTGKELVANAIHELSRRAKQPFVTVNCAAIPEALLESELFGYVRGAFTGAVQSRLGRVHVAHGGTLFLDEIGDLPLGMQAKLLRFLQNGEVQRLGSSDVYRMDVRVICATNVRLSEKVQARQFRQDLYYRLAVFPVQLPALRQRREDLEALAEFFLGKLAREAEVSAKRLSAGARQRLLSRQWAGNVRELQHALERAFILAGDGAELRAEHCEGLQEIEEFER